MGGQAGKTSNIQNADSYKPKAVPNALKVIHGARSVQAEQEVLPMEARLVTVDAFYAATLKARGSMKNFELGKDVRRAWHELQSILKREKAEQDDKELGYVFCPQWTTEHTEELELWVGVKVGSEAQIAEGVDILHIPKKTYAAVTCKGDRAYMDRAYSYIYDWMGQNGYVSDNSEGIFSMEPNRLIPVNPFDLPADKIDRFDFDIMIAIKG